MISVPRSILISIVVIAIASGGVSALTTRYLLSRNRALTARSLTLVDDQDRVVATFGVTAGAPELALLDHAGRKRAAMFLEKNGTPDLYLFDTNKKARAGLNLFDSGVPNLSYAAPGNGNSFVMFDSPSGRELRFSIQRADQGKVQTISSLELSADTEQPRLRVTDGQNHIIWEIPSQGTKHKLR